MLWHADQDRGVTSGWKQSPRRRSRNRAAMDERINSRSPGLWVEACDVTSEGNLATWPAKVGTSPTQATESKKPAGDSDGWAADNGPAVGFDGVGECMQTSTPNLNGMPTCTMAATYRAGNNSAHRQIVEYNVDWVTTNGCGIQSSTGGLATGATGDGANYRYGSAVADTSNTEQCLIASLDMSASATAMGDVYVNGAKVSDLDTNGGADPAGNYGTSTWNIGSRNNGAARPLDGCIRELVIYVGGIWTAADVAEVDKALRYKANML